MGRYWSKSILLLLLFALINSNLVGQYPDSSKIRNQRCEYLVDPVGIDVVVPRLSWEMLSDKRGYQQTAYQILVANSLEELAKNKSIVWDSRKVYSNQSNQIKYGGKKLESRKTYYWKLRVWDNDGKVSDWSRPAFWSMGLLQESDWKAKWITCTESGDTKNGRSTPWIRKNITVGKKLRRATAYVCSPDYHELYVNGVKVGNTVLNPVVSELDKRAIYVTYDLTSYLEGGDNVIALWVGNGFARRKAPAVFPDAATVKAQVELQYTNGTIDITETNERWKFHPSPLSVPGFRSELYDATKENTAWNKIDFDDGAWESVKIAELPPVLVSSQMVQPNRIVEEIHPLDVKEVSPGVYEIDMGRSYVGFFQLKIPRAAYGDRIIMEMNEHVLGSGLKNSFDQTDTYIANGTDQEQFCNRFDYRGFRYVTIRGLRQKPALQDALGYMIQTDKASAGSFTCSNDLLNRIQQVVDWTYRCVSLDGVIVDCPHRERLGYGAEGQATMLTAMTNYDAAAMFTHWMQIWRDVQDSVTGKLTHTAPKLDTSEGSPGWGGFIVTAPWEMYIRYGDKRILAQSFSAIQQWIKFLNSRSKNQVLEHYGAEEWGFFGDWLAPGRQLQLRWTNAVPKECDVFFNNCYFIYNLDIAAKIARVLGRETDALDYEKQAGEKRLAVHARFYSKQREVYVNGEQAYQAIALYTNVVPDNQRKKMERTLSYLITEAQKNHLNTGVLGTYFMFRELLLQNRNDLLFNIINRETFPGWGWILGQGATTIGEQWGGLHSQIHSSFLSVNSWFIEGVGGIQPDPAAPGYKHFFVKPAVVGDLSWANTSYQSEMGKIVSNWKKKENRLELDLQIPANTSATVYILAKDAAAIWESGTPVSELPSIQVVGTDGEYVVVRIGSGNYRFSVQ